MENNKSKSAGQEAFERGCKFAADDIDCATCEKKDLWRKSATSVLSMGAFVYAMFKAGQERTKKK